MEGTPPSVSRTCAARSDGSPVGATDETTAASVWLSRATGARIHGEILSSDGVQILVALDGPPEFPLEQGTAVGLGFDADPSTGSELSMVVGDVIPRGGMIVASLALAHRGPLGKLPWSPLRQMLNQRESFRTAVHADRLRSTRIAAVEPDGNESEGAEAFLLDASFEGIGLVVDGPTAKDLEDETFVRVTIDAEARHFEVVGAIRHRTNALRGARIGVAAGHGGPARWSERDEAELRAFVVDEQRAALSRRRHAG